MIDIGIRLTLERDLPMLNELDHVARGGSARRSFIKDATCARCAWTIEVSSEIADYEIMARQFFDRSSGYSPKLISFLENQSKSGDLFTSTSESNSHMQDVLERLGCERSGIIHNLDAGDPEIVYVKKVEL